MDTIFPIIIAGMLFLVLGLIVAVTIWTGIDAKKRGANALGWVVLVFLFPLFGSILYLCLRPRHKLCGASASRLDSTMAMPMIPSMLIKLETYFEKAKQELDSGQPRPGIFAATLDQTGGDETKAKALYLRLRVQHLAELERQRWWKEQVNVRPLFLVLFVVYFGFIIVAAVWSALVH